MSTTTSSRATDLDELHDWLHDNWDPAMTLREWWERLGLSGWGFAHFPVAWHGKGLAPARAGAISRAIRDFGAVPASVGFGPNLAAPTLLEHGTDGQRARHLPGIVTGADAFCQLFSEPNAGSDLAGLQTRAERDGDVWVVNGQKVWTSTAQIANKAILVARTNVDVPKHSGISYFIIDVTQPGVEIRPLREMTGRSYFNEVFITDARVPAEDLIGGENNGWAVANTTLAYERGYRNTGAIAPPASPGRIAGDLDRAAGEFTRAGESRGLRPLQQSSMRLTAVARHLGRTTDPHVRQSLVRLYMLERVNALTAQRARAMAERGQELRGLANLAKMGTNHYARLTREVTFDVLKEAALLYGYDRDAVAAVEAATGITGLGEMLEGALFATAVPIFGGSDQIQRNIVGERVLGLAKEPGDDRAVPFKDLRKN